MSTTLRQATEQDIPAMFRIRACVQENKLAAGATIPEEAVRLAITETGRGWVIAAEGQIVAFAISLHTGEIWALFVHPSEEGRGYGQRLHAEMVAYCWSYGLDRLWLTTQPNTRAQKFYERSGWQQTGVIEEGGDIRLELSHILPSTSQIQFLPLTEQHFPLMLSWLQKPHVKAWWDSKTEWTLERVYEKYSSYVQGFKNLDGLARPIHSFILALGHVLVGYLQVYNLYDFPRAKPLSHLPAQCAAFDIFIGEENSLRRGIGSNALRVFFEQKIDSTFTHAFADPDIDNIAAILAYEKAGFKKVQEHLDTHEWWMLKEGRVSQSSQPKIQLF